MKLTNKKKEELKAEHGAIYLVTSSDGKEGLLKKPDWKTYKYAVTMLAESPTKYAEALINNCWIDGVNGDDCLKTNDSYFLELKPQIDTIVETMDTPEVSKEGNYMVVDLIDYKVKLKPVTREIISLAESENPHRKPLVNEEKMLKRIYVSGADDLMQSKDLYYYIPLLSVVEKLRDKKAITIKKL